MFPLPDFVLFPCATAPIHVFELRYRALVRDALRADRLVAFALLTPGWERDYHGSPPFHPVGCLARVEQVTWQPDDCYDLWVTGLSRVRFGRITREYPYRAARVTLAPQEPLDDEDPLIQLERQALGEAYGRAAGADAIQLPPALEAIEGRLVTFEAFVNAICAELPMGARDKLALLELDSVLERGRRVRERIESELRRPKREGTAERN